MDDDVKLARLSVNMNEDTAKSLSALSAQLGISKTEVVRRAVAIMQFVADEQAKGRKFLTMDSNDRNVRELVLY